MNTCALCGGNLKKYEEDMEGVNVKGWKCQKCAETFYPSSEMLRYEILTGKRKNLTRKVRKVGKSIVVTLPEQLIRESHIHQNDYVLFEPQKDAVTMRIIHPKGH